MYEIEMNRKKERKRERNSFRSKKKKLVLKHQNNNIQYKNFHYPNDSLMTITHDWWWSDTPFYLIWCQIITSIEIAVQNDVVDHYHHHEMYDHCVTPWVLLLMADADDQQVKSSYNKITIIFIISTIHKKVVKPESWIMWMMFMTMMIRVFCAFWWNSRKETRWTVEKCYFLPSLLLNLPSSSSSSFMKMSVYEWINR